MKSNKIKIVKILNNKKINISINKKKLKKENILEQINNKNKNYKGNLSLKENIYYTPNKSLYSKNYKIKKRLKKININNKNKLDEIEIVSVLKQNRYYNRPLSSKIQKRNYITSKEKNFKSPLKLNLNRKQNTFNKNIYRKENISKSIQKDNLFKNIVNKKYEFKYKRNYSNKKLIKKDAPFKSNLNYDFLNLFCE